MRLGDTDPYHRRGDRDQVQGSAREEDEGLTLRDIEDLVIAAGISLIGVLVEVANCILRPAAM